MNLKASGAAPICLQHTLYKGNEAERFLAQTAELDIRGWASKIHTAVSRCREAGQSCAPRPHALPKRLIQVQNEDLGEETVRMYQTKIGELGNYVALSHVWGGPQKVTTTHSNIAQHLASISVKSLGKSIRDAITFVRVLGIRYLWVDALCIVQESDKIDEINNIGKIYRDAWVVIAAEASHEVEQGFLQEWPVRRSPTLDISLPNGRSGTVMIGAGGLDSLETQARPKPLRSRGWGFQESMLSRRLLTLHSESISYNCTTSSHGVMIAFDKTRSCEGGTSNIDGSYINWWLTGAVISSPHRLTLTIIRAHPLIDKGLGAAAQSQSATDVGGRQSLLLIWRDITWEYAERQLAVWSDRLPAIAGKATQFEASIGSENYLAGLWKPWIISQLAWLPYPLLMAVPERLPIDKDVRFLKAMILEGFAKGSDPVKADGFVTGTYLPSSPSATLARYRKVGRSAILQSPTWSWYTHQHSGRWLNGLREDAVMISSTQTLVSDKVPFGAVLNATITIQAQFVFLSAMEERLNWSSSYLYMEYSGDVMAECGIEPSLYMLLGAMIPDSKDQLEEPLDTIGLVLRACKEDSQRCLFGKSLRIPHYQRIGIIKVASRDSHIWYGLKAQGAVVTLI
ncbi:heterokaryon incompatibility protein-domain-containing protein [Colletotrichum navitas]|uniref:Heterokaryon incompatibility protein-domain-containing protein n=1 Tax=Colletotrichum navitas TaxID=681940 RepID=A0AAD8PYV4_9PEZI|nr:heterokaryon incompatibility protein-domain-containing protein [Colletotrichum navitas]KAK1590079.1 heterokaryon incompatibility protein-domain-containing protein [Colletotrichum navitas]